MKNTKASVGNIPTLVTEIKKNIMSRTIKKIESISEKANEIRKMNDEFYMLMGKTQIPITTVEQMRTKKKIDVFRREIEEKWGEIWREKIEIYAIIDTLYILSETKNINDKVKGPGQISWTDIRQEIQKKMEKTLVDEKRKK